MKIKLQKHRCKFCGNVMSGGREYLANSFCSDCLDERLEASEAIDLRNNYRIIDEGNGYVQVVPIDETKLWKARR